MHRIGPSGVRALPLGCRQKRRWPLKSVIFCCSHTDRVFQCFSMFFNVFNVFQCLNVTLQTCAPENFRSRRWGAEWRVLRAQTLERGPPSTWAEIYMCNYCTVISLATGNFKFIKFFPSSWLKRKCSVADAALCGTMLPGPAFDINLDWLDSEYKKYCKSRSEQAHCMICNKMNICWPILYLFSY